MKTTNALGSNAGYTVDWPTQVPNAEFIVDRLIAGARIGAVRLWRKAENIRRLWEQGVEPIGLQVEESSRLGIDHWFRLSMNDWHHWGGGFARADIYHATDIIAAPGRKSDRHRVFFKAMLLD